MFPKKKTQMATCRIDNVRKMLEYALLVFIWNIQYINCHTCDPISNYLCAQAVFSGNYDNCAGVIDNFPDTWGVCEIKDCMDLDSINNYTGISKIQRQQVNRCLQNQ